MKVSIPMRNGTGASNTSIMLLGKMGTSTCFQQSGNKNEMSATEAWVRRALCWEMRRTFFSRSRARKISMTYSASSALNKYSISDFYKNDHQLMKVVLLLHKVGIDREACRMVL
jgi:hypothetical protein